MYFRFGVAILLVVVISVCGVAVEKSMLGFRREISRQEFRKEVLLEERERLRLTTQQLGAPTRVLQTLHDSEPNAASRESKRGTARPAPRRPLLRWQRGSDD